MKAFVRSIVAGFFGISLLIVCCDPGNAQEPFSYGSPGHGDNSLLPTLATQTQAASDSPEAMSDFRSAQNVGTTEAYEAFLRKHPSGLYANIAREQHAKLTAERDAALRQTDTPGAAELVRLAQDELVRIGCFAGPADGNFNDATQAAIKQYQARRGYRNAPLEISESFIADLKARTARVCPLVCPAGEVAQGEQCIAARKQTPVARQKNDSQDEAANRRSRAKQDERKSQPAARAQPSRQEAGPSRSRPSGPSGLFIGGGGIGIGVGF